MNDTNYQAVMANRFRGYLPVIIDVETGGFNADTDALLEIAAVTIRMDTDNRLALAETYHAHITPFEGANIEPKALEFNGIDPYHPFRLDKNETDVLKAMFKMVRKAIKASGCKRAILVGHNAVFDLNFLNAAVERCQIKRNPFHPFSTFDTVTLAGLAYGQTVLARAAMGAGIDWDSDQAHSALYDAEQTARLFCGVINEWERLSPGTWRSQLPDPEP